MNELGISACYDGLVRSSYITKLLHEAVGQLHLSTTALPSDSPASLLGHARRYLLRCRWLLDSQLYTLLVCQRKPPLEIKNIALRLFIHVLRRDIHDQTSCNLKPSVQDKVINRHLLLGVIVSCFRLIIGACDPLSTDEEDLIRSTLDSWVDACIQEASLSDIEVSIVQELIPRSLDVGEDIRSQGIISYGVDWKENLDFDLVLSQVVTNKEISITEIVNNVGENVDTFWKAFDLLNVVCSSTIAIGHKLNAVVGDALHLHLESCEGHHPLSTFLLQSTYCELPFLKFSSHPKTLQKSPMVDRLRRIQKLEVLSFQKDVLSCLDAAPSAINSDSNNLPRPEADKDLVGEAKSPGIESQMADTVSALTTPNDDIAAQIGNLIDKTEQVWVSTSEIRPKSVPTIDDIPISLVPSPTSEVMKLSASKTHRRKKRTAASSMDSPSTEATSTQSNTPENIHRQVWTPKEHPLNEVQVANDSVAGRTSQHQGQEQDHAVGIPSAEFLMFRTWTDTPSETTALDSTSRGQDDKVLLPHTLDAYIHAGAETTTAKIGQSPPPPFSSLHPAVDGYHQDPSWLPNKEMAYDSGLEVVTEDHHPVIIPDSMSVMNQSVKAPSVSSSRKASIFSKLTRRPKVKVTEKSSKLQSSLEFCFSSCGSRVLLWKRKHSSQLFSITYPFYDGVLHNFQVNNSTTSQPSAETPCHIRFVAASSLHTAVLLYNEGIQRLCLINTNSEQQYLNLDRHTPLVQQMAISSDGTFVALGCGTSIHLYRMLHGRLEMAEKLDLTSRLQTSNICGQCLNFSVDSKKLVAATQTVQGPQKHAVYITVWECSGAQVREQANLDPVPLHAGYGDDTGISGVFYSHDAGDRVPARVVLTAGMSKSYASIIFLGSGHRNRHLELSDKRIDAAAQCCNTAMSRHVVVKSGRHRVLLCDTRTGATQPIADLTAERKNMTPKNEKMALGIVSDSLMYVIWKKGDHDLRLSRLGKEGKGGIADTMDLAEVYNRCIGIQ